MIKYIFSVFFVSLLVITTTPAFSADTPIVKDEAPGKIVESTIGSIVDAVEALPGKEKQTERREKLKGIITPRFDFDEMARLSLGTFWKERTEEERKEFVKVFSSLLSRTYLSHIETVTRDMVKIKNERVEIPKALVKTVVTNKGDQFPIDYKLYTKDGKWMVYDVIIENIGLVANYRTEFAGIIRKDKFEGLMKKLHEKAAKST